METQPGKIEEKEFIVKAAIRISSGKVFVGKEHSKIFREFAYELLDIPHEQTEEGFTTNKGRFVSRQEAAEIAFKAKQIDRPVDKLISQNLDLE